jgi:hypothetical protein
MNLEAIADLETSHPGLELVFIESGGDNLAASFSPELVDLSIYVIEVAGGDKIPRKGGPGITRSDLLVINKIDLAPYVGASLEGMDRDSRRMRRRPVRVHESQERQGTAGGSTLARTRIASAAPASLMRTRRIGGSGRATSIISLLMRLTIPSLLTFGPDALYKKYSPTPCSRVREGFCPRSRQHIMDRFLHAET